ncbi:hypothetical protein X929_07285 [Petrotoga olearia DSM 13574]|uniref:Uncharacterized protein n=1 Tax=Petrotoga olearia DSM 13574 TaxID=1122955 RepID=A0A2K1NYL9_9BACT|nr:hypothetical protein X929_07285 [Petrotoga olearia DSM 13574]
MLLNEFALDLGFLKGTPLNVQWHYQNTKN